MISRIQIVLPVLLIAFVIMLSGCKGKEGDPGPAGDDGPQGVGFDEAIKYGNVVLRLAGESEDDIEFNDTINFKFSSQNLYYSSVVEYEPNDIQTIIKRWVTFDSYFEDDYIAPNMRITVSGTDTTFAISSRIRLFIPLNNSGDNRGFVRFEETWYNNDGANIENAEVKGYKYDKNTGSLYYRFSYTVPAEENITNHEVTVSGVVNVKVFIDDND